MDPNASPTDTPIKSPSFGFALAVLASGGFFSGLEVLLVGEEMSTLGRRLLAVSRDTGRYRFLATDLGVEPVLVGCVVFAIACARILSGAAIALGHPKGRRLALMLLAPSLLVDALCFSIPLVWLVMSLDVLAAATLWWVGRLDPDR